MLIWQKKKVNCYRLHEPVEWVLASLSFQAKIYVSVYGSTSTQEIGTRWIKSCLVDISNFPHTLPTSNILLPVMLPITQEIHHFFFLLMV